MDENDADGEDDTDEYAEQLETLSSAANNRAAKQLLEPTSSKVTSALESASKENQFTGQSDPVGELSERLKDVSLAQEH